jgi:DNA-binding XRE family transcriptional regulator
MSDRPAHRPTQYDPSHCEKVVEWGKLGKSRAWMASRLNVTYQTLLNWERTHPEFFDALALAEMHAQALWEDEGQTNLQNREFQSSVWSRSMAARFPKHWREKTAHVGGDDDDNPIKTESKVDLGLDEFARRIAGIATRSDQNGGDQSADA